MTRLRPLLLVASLVAPAVAGGEPLTRAHAVARALEANGRRCGPRWPGR